MRRRSFIVTMALLLILILPSIGIPSRSRPAASATTLLIQLDPSLAAHPYLQFGAQVDPTRPVRVIVQKVSPTISSQLIANVVGASILEEFPFINGFVVEVPQGVVPTLASLVGVRYVTYDGPIRFDAVSAENLRTTYQEALAIPQVWNDQAQAATGRGVTIAVLDSGVDRSHPDLQDNVSAQSMHQDDGGDGHGHGTHIVGIINGRDPGGRYIGVAPDAYVISVKIADEDGHASEADLLRGLQWVHNHRTSENIRVVNLSVSVGFPASSVTSPVAAAVERLWRSGIVVVASAGNRGQSLDAAWFPPGNDPFVITVGALDHNETVDGADDSLATFSSRGRTQTGQVKPDIIAPGRRIVAPLASGGVVLAEQYPERITDRRYLRLSGTSMATPIVSGIVALLLERYPALTPDQVKGVLVQAAAAYPEQVTAAGVVQPVAALSTAASNEYDEANQGLLPSIDIGLIGTLTEWDQAYWDQAYWDQAYWDQAYWDQAELD